MTTIKRFEEIKSWQKGRELCSLVYGATRQVPFKRDYALCTQIQRAAVSIVSNIAEGFETQNNRTFMRHLYIAKGSAAEVRAQAYIALDQAYINEATFDALYETAAQTGRLIAGLIAYLGRHPDGPPGAR